MSSWREGERTNFIFTLRLLVCPVSLLPVNLALPLPIYGYSCCASASFQYHSAITPVYNPFWTQFFYTLFSAKSLSLPYPSQRPQTLCNDHIVLFLSVLCAWKNHSSSSIVLSQTLIQASECGLETPIQPCLPLTVYFLTFQCESFLFYAFLTLL